MSKDHGGQGRPRVDHTGHPLLEFWRDSRAPKEAGAVIAAGYDFADPEGRLPSHERISAEARKEAADARRRQEPRKAVPRQEARDGRTGLDRANRDAELLQKEHAAAIRVLEESDPPHGIGWPARTFAFLLLFLISLPLDLTVVSVLPLSPAASYLLAAGIGAVLAYAADLGP